MSDKPELDISVNQGSAGNANLIYILYFASIIVGVTSIVGVVMAYLGRGEADPVTKSHYDNQIGIFWKGLLYMFAGILLSVILIGVLILLASFVWFVVRNVKGIQALSKGEPIANPRSWGF